MKNELRDVELDGHRLTTWDTDRTGYLGKYILHYRLSRPDGSVVFEGEDFACSPLHAVDSDEILRSILGFLTLRPGDTDPDYFDSYTDEQLEWADRWGEQLSRWTDHDGPPFTDWKELDHE